MFFYCRNFQLIITNLLMSVSDEQQQQQQQSVDSCDEKLETTAVSSQRSVVMTIETGCTLVLQLASQHK